MAGSRQLHRPSDESAGRADPKPVEPTRRVGSTGAPPRRERALTTEDDGLEADALLELLDDDYARQILEALSGEPRPARELADACDASRPTVYRRLNRMVEYDLVTVDTQLHPDGHHRKVFASTIERATFDFVDGVPRVRLVVADPDPDGEQSSRPAIHAD